VEEEDIPREDEDGEPPDNPDTEEMSIGEERDLRPLGPNVEPLLSI